MFKKICMTVLLISFGTSVMNCGGDGDSDLDVIDIFLISEVITLRALVTAGNGTTGTTVDFTDNKDGTIYHAGLDMTVTRCLFGQTYRVSNDDCKGGGTAFAYGANSSLRFCGADNNSCNGGTNTGTLASGTLFDACDQLSLASKTDWRVPTQTEFQNLWNTIFGVQPSLALLFNTNSGTSQIWTASGAERLSGNAYMFTGWDRIWTRTNKSTSALTICVQAGR